MRSITDTPDHSRYLTVAYRLPNAEWSDTVASVNKWLDAKPHTINDCELAMMRKTINMPMSPTQLACVVYHCYADIPARHQWDTMFRIDNPSDRNGTLAISCFGVYWNRAVTECLDDGHHVAAVLDFPNGTPELINSLPVGDDGNVFGTLGLCNSEDYPAIQTELRNAG